MYSQKDKIISHWFI